MKNRTLNEYRQVKDFDYLMLQVIDISEWFCVPINCIPRHPKNNNQIHLRL